MTEQDQPVAPVAHRRRGQALEHELLRAAWDELNESGWAGFQMERVADRCGASKASIYRRWPNRAELLLATFEHMADAGEPPVPAQGDLREQLVAIIMDIARVLSGPVGDVMRAVITVAATDTGKTRLRTPVRAIAEVVADAIDTGELTQRAFHPQLLDLGPSLATHHFLFSGHPPTEEECIEIVDLIWLPALRG